jgi:hypothetical protein
MRILLVTGAVTVAFAAWAVVVSPANPPGFGRRDW